MSSGKYVKKEFPTEVILESIVGSQDDGCKTHSSLQFMLMSRTVTSITSNESVGPPMSDVTVVVNAVRSYISVHCKTRGYKLTTRIVSDRGYCGCRSRYRDSCQCKIIYQYIVGYTAHYV